MTLDELIKTHEPLIMFNANDGDYHIICNCWSHDKLHEWDYVGHLKTIIEEYGEERHTQGWNDGKDDAYMWS